MSTPEFTRRNFVKTAGVTHHASTWLLILLLSLSSVAPGVAQKSPTDVPARADAAERDSRMKANSETTPLIEPQNSGTTAFGGLETHEPLTDARIDGIARDLLGQLTLEEKINMMSGEPSFYPGLFHMNSGAYNRPR